MAERKGSALSAEPPALRRKAINARLDGMGRQLQPYVSGTRSAVAGGPFKRSVKFSV